MTNLLEIRNLHVGIGDKEIVKGVDLVVNRGEVHAIMGPNGSGKSTLASTLMGHPFYTVTKGDVLFDGQDIAALSADQRAKLGIFLAFQYPHSVPGVTVANFLRTAVNSVRGGNGNKVSPREFRAELRGQMATLQMDDSVAGRYINEGFSGGEKKRAEILQMAMLKPKLAIMDETDSGLDIDALRIVAEGVTSQLGPELGVLLITHYQRILNYITPDFVHVMAEGRIVANGGPELAHELERSGYAAFVGAPAGA
ncbi:MAG TPA: Fe-S cluster assembly ATPase SufC [Chloroflexota bacterium]|jgi:Fe-S cluster assembly ATP-binding protein|nr:Fe-S cluster assembly ATPase SufC [Chloroflexota bacterium]